MSQLIDESVAKLAAISDLNDVCPNCKSDRYLNPNMVLVVSDCFHKMCEACVDRLYGISSGPCPVYLSVEKEVRIRKRLAQYYNKNENDFETTREYDDYLEELEDIIYNLFNNIDIEETEKKIKEYREANAEQIKYNHKLKADQDKQFKKEQADERERKLKDKDAYLKKINKEEEQKLLDKEELINDLTISAESADKIVKRFEELASKKQKIGYDTVVTNKDKKEQVTSYREFLKLQQGNKQKKGLFNPIVKYHLLDKDQPKFKKRYREIRWKPNPEFIIRAKAGGYKLRTLQKKSVKSLYLGTAEPVDLEDKDSDDGSA
ncbi:CDK-activating kinase assembly factor [Neoconidiobolus thromboides FSU 785]|nr:CDK-activating kinase assembly factor [Neoconidiobolus thromboides FSU 785]